LGKLLLKFTWFRRKQERKMTFLGRIASAAAVGVLIAASVSTPRAQAAFVLTLEQEGPNVVATGSGTLDPTDLGFDGFEFSGSFLVPSDSEIFTGAAGEFILYAGTHGPVNLGSGGLTFASSGSGDIVTLGFNTIGVPLFYVSGSALSDSATYDDATFASLGIRAGVYCVDVGDGRGRRQLHGRRLARTLDLGAARHRLARFGLSALAPRLDIRRLA
jgi:hypothetical protein